jgi:hypothetical protein
VTAAVYLDDVRWMISESRGKWRFEPGTTIRLGIRYDDPRDRAVLACRVCQVRVEIAARRKVRCRCDEP